MALLSGDGANGALEEHERYVFDKAVAICAENLLRDAAHDGKLHTNPGHGHGLMFDRFLEKCRKDLGATTGQ